MNQAIPFSVTCVSTISDSSNFPSVFSSKNSSNVPAVVSPSCVAVNFTISESSTSPKSGIFTGSPADNLEGTFDNDTDHNIFKATFGSSFGSLSFGAVAQAGLSEEFVANDLTVVGSLAGGGGLGEVDLVYVPEPTTALLLAVGLLMGLVQFRRANRRD